MSKFYLDIAGTDYGPQGLTMLQAIDLEPAGVGKIGIATIHLVENSNVASVLDKAEVRIYELSGAPGTSVVYRWFGGFVSARRFSKTVGSTQRTIEISCQDYNLLLDALVLDMDPVHPYNTTITIPSGTYASQVLWITDKVQRNLAGTLPPISIDASTNVANLWATMPALTLARGHSLRWYLTQIGNSAYGQSSALKPRFFMAPQIDTSTTVGHAAIFAYDGALSPSPLYSFAESPTGGQYAILPPFERFLDGSRLVSHRQYGWKNDLNQTGYVDYTESGSVSSYPNNYINHGYGTGTQGGWGAELVQDDTANNAGTAQADLDRVVQASAYPRETIRFRTNGPRVPPGTFVSITWPYEGLSGALYRVVGTTVKFPTNTNSYYEQELTCGVRVLELGENGDPDIDTPPIEGDHAAPDPPTSVTVASNTYNAAADFSIIALTWTLPTATDIDHFVAYWTVGGVQNNSTWITGSTTTSWQVTMPPGETFSIYLTAVDHHGNESQPSNTVTGTSYLGVTPNAYNGGFEIPLMSNPLLARGWDTSGSTGSGSRQLVSGAGHSGLNAYKLIVPNNTSTSYIGSSHVGINARLPIQLWFWAWASPIGQALKVQVTWYDNGLNPIRTDTLATGLYVAAGWNQYVWPIMPPTTAAAMSVQLTALFTTANTNVYVDDVGIYQPPQPPAQDGGNNGGGINQYPGSLGLVQADASTTYEIDTTAANTYRGMASHALTVPSVANAVIKYQGMPQQATAGEVWAAWTAVMATTSPGTAYLTLRWFDSSDTLISETTIFSGTPTGSFVEQQGQATAPANTKYVRVAITHQQKGIPATTPTAYFAPPRAFRATTPNDLRLTTASSASAGAGPIGIYDSAGALALNEFIQGAASDGYLEWYAPAGNSGTGNMGFKWQARSGNFVMLWGGVTGSEAFEVQSAGAVFDLVSSSGLTLNNDVFLSHVGFYRGGGNSFPASPSTGDKFFRNDLKVWCFYDGTRWLGVDKQRVDLKKGSALRQTFSATTAPWTEAGPPDDGSWYVEKITWWGSVATTNNGSNYWTLRLAKYDNGFGGSVVQDVNTSAKTAGANWAISASPGVVIDFSNGNAMGFFTEIRKDNGSPGNLTVVDCALIVRRVYT